MDPGPGSPRGNLGYGIQPKSAGISWKAWLSFTRVRRIGFLGNKANSRWVVDGAGVVPRARGNVFHRWHVIPRITSDSKFHWSPSCRTPKFPGLGDRVFRGFALASAGLLALWSRAIWYTVVVALGLRALRELEGFPLLRGLDTASLLKWGRALKAGPTKRQRGCPTHGGI